VAQTGCDMPVCESLDLSSDDQTTCEQLESKSVTHMIEFGDGTYLQ